MTNFMKILLIKNNYCYLYLYNLFRKVFEYIQGDLIQILTKIRTFISNFIKRFNGHNFRLSYYTIFVNSEITGRKCIIHI